ncbi:hypothetical protein GCM10011403_10970 [Pseudohongiella nitratireducens]|uniref:Uncharacterized protein n=1 Tax=Pseudohongiella nitratireducens TaxID=1768907 RepID=A0A917LU72_9GAMM|nr:hypothetical protein GCM10011403_10970 [Pseudohongiella nitratireducens]
MGSHPAAAHRGAGESVSHSLAGCHGVSDGLNKLGTRAAVAQFIVWIAQRTLLYRKTSTAYATVQIIA